MHTFLIPVHPVSAPYFRVLLYTILYRPVCTQSNHRVHDSVSLCTGCAHKTNAEVRTLSQIGIFPMACSGYVRKYYDVKNRTFLRNCMRDFDHFYAQFFFVHPKKYDKCENRAFSIKEYARFSNLMCEITHRAALTLSLGMCV